MDDFIDLTVRGGYRTTNIARCIQQRYNKGYSLHTAECSGVLFRIYPNQIRKKNDDARIYQFISNDMPRLSQRIKEPGRNDGCYED